jgi:RNA polymerase sigma-70 factor (ECF subfamily)
MEGPPTALTDIDPSPVGVHAGDGAEAFVSSAYEAHHAALFAFLVRSTRDRSAAEDLLQETYLRLMAEARLGRAPQEVRSWLFRVSTNLVVERYRRSATALRWLGRNGRTEVERLTAGSPEARLLRQERAAEIDQVLEGLAADARLGLLLSNEGFHGREIAIALGRSDAATRTLLCRARTHARIQRDQTKEGGR